MKRILPILIVFMIVSLAVACTDSPVVPAVETTTAQPAPTDQPIDVGVDVISVPISELIVSSPEEMPELTVLLGMTSLKRLDLTALPSTPYTEIEQIRNALPNCEVIWNQQLTDGVFRSDSASLTLPNATAEDIGLLEAFANLQSVDASGSSAYDALLAFRKSHPDIEMHYTLTLGDTVINETAETLSVPQGTNAQQLINDLRAFDCIKEVDLRDSGWDDASMQAFADAYPQLKVRRLISVGSLAFDSDEQMLDLRSLSDRTPDQLIPILQGFSELKQIALPASWSDADIERIRAVFPQLSIIGPVTAFDKIFDGTAEEIDLSKIKLTDTNEVEALLQSLPFLRKLVMCECGLTDEQMEQLCKAHPDIRFVWTVVIGKRKLRTDAIAFSTKNPSKYTNPNSSDKYNESVKKAVRLHEGDIEPLKYCTDLVALDLGHNYLTDNDLAVIAGLTKLRILILADNKITDISALTTLQELEYIELFMNRIPDLSPLCELPNLSDVNVCNTGVSDLSPLFRLPSVKRLWYAMNPFNREDAKQLKESLPDCQCNYTTRNETAEGWREDPRYQWMRAFFADS